MKHLLLLLGLYLPLLAMAAPEARVQTRLVPGGDTVVGATVELQVDLLVDTWFTQPPVLPVIDLPGATVSAPSGEAQHLNQQHDGKTFFGLRYTYQITPQAACSISRRWFLTGQPRPSPSRRNPFRCSRGSRMAR